MLPLYLAGEVTLLGVAKIVLGWPAYLGAVAVMGLILVRGRTARGPARRHGRLTPSADTLARAAPAGVRPRPRGSRLAGREHRLEVVLDLGRGDEQQLVAGLERRRRGWARSGGPRG